MTIAVDFDGTIVDHKYPEIGEEKPFAFDVLRQLAADGNKLILWTVREGELLEQAVEFCRSRGVEFYAVNSAVPANSLFSNSPSASRKIDADVYIDDRNLGGLPDWGEIYEKITERRYSRLKSRSSSHRGCWLFGSRRHRSRTP